MSVKKKPNGKSILTTCLLGFGLVLSCAARNSQNTNSDAAAIKEFTERVEQYAKLREKVDGPAPDLKKKSEPERIVAHERILAEEIRKARASAQPGDIFAPSIQPVILRLIKSEVDATSRKALLEDGNPAAEGKKVPLKVNQDYPEKAPMSTVPPKLLMALPKLPKDIEYRFVGRHLILLDVRANVIADFVTNAVR